MSIKLLNFGAGAIRYAGLLTLAALIAIAPAGANDSSASLDADGLHFTYKRWNGRGGLGDGRTSECYGKCNSQFETANAQHGALPAQFRELAKVEPE